MIIEWTMEIKEALKKGVKPMVCIRMHNDPEIIGMYVVHNDKRIQIDCCGSVSGEKELKFSWDEIFDFRIISEREAVTIINRYDGFLQQIEASLGKIKQFRLEVFKKNK